MGLSGDTIDGLCRENNLWPVSDGGRSPLERILASLQDSRRRFLLYHLQDENPSTLEAAGRQVAAWEVKEAPEDVPTEVHEQVKIDLYHTHLPKLADLNVIEYDTRSRAIRLRDPPAKLTDFLELARQEDDIG